MNYMKGGTGATLIAVFLAATFAGGVSIAGMTSTFTNAFDSINTQDDLKWLEDYIRPNVRGVCNDDVNNGHLKFPADSNFSNRLEGIEAIRIRQGADLWGAGDDYKNLQVRYQGGGQKKDIRLDTNGWLGGWACNGADGGIKLNTTSNPSGVDHGTWVPTPEQKTQHFRILESGDGQNSQNQVKIQVRQTG